jgi:hypothetical protein
MNLQLKRFDPSKIASDKVILFIGKRGSGKSTLVMDIMYHKRNIPTGVVMSATEDGNHFYKQYIPDLFIYGCYNKETIENIIQRQSYNINKYGSTNNVFILLDDLMFDKSFLKDDCIRTLFMNGRHWKVFFMVTAQYCMDLPPALRTNIDYVFCLRENIIQNREKLYKSFFGVFPTFGMFQQVLDACTENYECLVIDNTSRSNKINECVFYYKAVIRPPFKIGGPAMWEAHRKYYNEKHTILKKDPTNVKKTTIHVKKI